MKLSNRQTCQERRREKKQAKVMHAEKNEGGGVV